MCYTIIRVCMCVYIFFERENMRGKITIPVDKHVILLLLKVSIIRVS